MADGWLSTLFGYHRIKDALDAVFPQRSTLKFIGASVTDDTSNKQTVVDISAGVNGSITVRKNTGSDVGTRGRLNLIEGSGVSITALDDAGGGEVDITFAAAETLQQAYTNGGSVDAGVAGTNTLLVRAADALSDVLLRMRRNATGADAEQTVLKAPDATATISDGTRLDLRSGLGAAATGSSSASSGGQLRLLAGDGGAAVDGVGGDGGGVLLKAGKGGAVNGTGGTGTVGQPNEVRLEGGDGGNSSDDAVDGGDGGALVLVGGAGGTGTGGEFGSADGADGPVQVGTEQTSIVQIGPTGTIIPIAIAGQVSMGHPSLGGGSNYVMLLQSAVGVQSRIFVAATTPAAGVDGDVWLSTSGQISVYRGGWLPVLDAGGGTLVGPLLTTAVAVTFGTTPSVNLTLGDDFVLGQITSDFDLTLSNPAAGMSGTLSMVQDGTGGWKLGDITCPGLTVRILSGPVNTADFMAAGARSVLVYKLVQINGADLCLVSIQSDGAAAPDYS